MPWGNKPLGRRTILLVEDNLLLAECMRDLLQEAGATVIEPREYDDFSIAFASSKIEFHGAVLDAVFNWQSTADLAHRLTEQGVPFVVLTGRDKSTLPNELQCAPYLAKPVDASVLVETAARLFWR
jgi:DNA-binding response OmpR family regulator